ncbi:unnamed protein product [Dicrocoelium dendriticum]|nr:unnamed protein product [Dicrocoelium dendriticum]
MRPQPTVGPQYPGLVGHRYHYSAAEHKSDGLEDAHEQLSQELTQKVSNLRSLSIRIGDELREQNSLLSGMAGAFDRSEGILRSTMSRVLGLGKHGSSAGLYCYLLCFAVLFFFICWLMLRFRW